MKLQRIVTTSFISLALLCLVFQTYLSHSVVRSAFLDLERAEVAADVRRAKNGVADLLQDLERFVLDWAIWDDTYAFIGGKNNRYIESNLVDSTYSNLGLNAIILWNNEGEVVYGRTVMGDGKDTPELFTFLLNIRSELKSSILPGSKHGTTGITLIGQDLLLVALHPVFPSNGEGSPDGDMLMARLLTSEGIAEFSRRLELPLVFQTPADRSSASNVWDTLESGKEIVVIPEGENVHGFSFLDDSMGGEPLLIQVTKPRRIMEALGKTDTYGRIFLTLVLVAVTILALWMLRRRVLLPLERLTTQVLHIGDGTNNMDRVVVEGEDEISQLGHSVNLMLDKVRETTADLANANEKLSTVLRTLPDAIWLKSPDGIFLDCNPAFAAMLGSEIEHIIGKNDYDFFSRELADSFREFDRKATETNTVSINEEWLDARRCNETIKTPMYDAQGKLVGVLGIAHDITSRKRAEAQREQMERLFIHDLRSPLASINDVIKLIRMEVDCDPEQDELLQAVEYAGYKMLGLVGASLALQKMEEGTYQLVDETFNLSRELERIITLFELSRERKDEIVIRVDGRAPQAGESIVIRGDGILCFSMLNNLMDNAMEAAPAGTIVNIDLERGDGEVSIAIHNHGAVPEAIRSRFFEKFVTAGKMHGNGLGTYSAKLITEAHGGSIDMRTSDETGTTITIRLPGLMDDGKKSEA